MLRSGMIALALPTPGDELLEVTEVGFTKTVEFVGQSVLLDYGVLMPEP